MLFAVGSSLKIEFINTVEIWIKRGESIKLIVLIMMTQWIPETSKI